MMRRISALSLGFLLSWSGGARAYEAPLAEKYLTEGKLAEGEKVLAERLNGQPDDAQTRFGLGTIQFVRGVERVVQSFHRFGLRTHVAGNALPFDRLPIPENPDPQPIGYEDLRGIFQAWVDDLARAEATLAKVQDDQVKLPIHIGEVRLDINGDGKADVEETLWGIFASLNRAAGDPQVAAASKQFVIGFDRADVAWLRGYCHLLMAQAEIYLAHDGRVLFEHTGPLFFARAKSPYAFLARPPGEPRQPFGTEDVFDAIAMIHLLRLPVVEPKRLLAVVDHLESMIALSRESWKFILSETDDDHEWIPSPKQHTVVPGITVTDEMVQGWTEFLDEFESLLQGKKLIPFWRAREARGVNLRRVFTEPSTFDLVLWVQGTAAAPYLEDGPQTSAEVWRRLQRVFRGEFIGFALWFN